MTYFFPPSQPIVPLLYLSRVPCSAQNSLSMPVHLETYYRTKVKHHLLWETLSDHLLQLFPTPLKRILVIACAEPYPPKFIYSSPNPPAPHNVTVSGDGAFNKVVMVKFQGGSVVKNQPANAGEGGSIPRTGRSPGGGNGNPLQYSHWENPMDQRSLEGYSPWGHKESDTTE